jgi:CheY-like chemotaxis protein
MSKVLVVDDSALMRRLLTSVLGAAGFEVVTARNGLEGVQLLTESQPDVVTLDINMPEMDGLTARSGGKAGRGSENKVPFVVAVQTTEDGQPHLACLSARPFTKASLETFISTSMVLPLTVVSDGLNCFTVAASMGAVHDREVTGGQGQRLEREVPSGQHADRQHQDGTDGHLPLDQVRQVRVPLPGRGAIPLQSALQHARHAAQPVVCTRRHPAAAQA